MFFPNYKYSYIGTTPETQRMGFTKMSWNYWTFRKAYREFTCALCDAQHKPGMRYVGDGFNKICMKCAPIYMENTIRAFKGWLKHIKIHIGEYKTNEQKWMKEALVGALEHTNDIK